MPAKLGKLGRFEYVCTLQELIVSQENHKVDTAAKTAAQEGIPLTFTMLRDTFETTLDQDVLQDMENSAPKPEKD